MYPLVLSVPRVKWPRQSNLTLPISLFRVSLIFCYRSTLLTIICLPYLPGSDLCHRREPSIENSTPHFWPYLGSFTPRHVYSLIVRRLRDPIPVSNQRNTLIFGSHTDLTPLTPGRFSSRTTLTSGTRSEHQHPRNVPGYSGRPKIPQTPTHMALT